MRYLGSIMPPVRLPGRPAAMEEIGRRNVEKRKARHIFRQELVSLPHFRRYGAGEQDSNLRIYSRGYEPKGSVQGIGMPAVVDPVALFYRAGRKPKINRTIIVTLQMLEGPPRDECQFIGIGGLEIG